MRNPQVTRFNFGFTSLAETLLLILTRYFVRELLTSTFVITGVLMMIVISARLIVYLNQAVSGAIATDMVFYIVLFNIPSFLQLIMPLGFYISILLIYGRMYVENEMTVLHATGFSPAKVLKITLVSSTTMAILVAILSLWLAPKCAELLDRFYQEQQKESELSFLTPGRFHAIGKQGDKVSYTEGLSADRKEMEGVFIADGDVLLVADSGSQYVNEETGSRYLELKNGRRFDGTAGQAEFRSLGFESYAIKIAEESAEAKAARQEAKSSLALLQSAELEDRAQLHYRFGLILLIPIVTLIAFPLAKVNPRQGRYSRLLPAILIYMAYYSALVTGLSVMGDGKTPEWAGLWWIHAIFIAIGLLLMFGGDLWRAIRAPKQPAKPSSHNKGGQHA